MWESRQDGSESLVSTGTYPLAMLYSRAPSDCTGQRHLCRVKWMYSPANLLLRLRRMGKLRRVLALAEFLHTPENISSKI